jgi:hypothetical protein
VAGAELIACDPASAPGGAVGCARRFTAADVAGVLDADGDATTAAAVCATHGDLPTIAIDAARSPCATVWSGVDQRAAGVAAGHALGGTLRDGDLCAYDHLVIVADAVLGDASNERVDGLREGFELACGEVAPERITIVEPPGDGGGLATVLGPLLEGAAANARLAILGVNDRVSRAATDIADALAAPVAVSVGTVGADVEAWEAIACDPRWVAAVALFPERYGRTVVPALLDLLAGEPVPAALPTPHAIVDAHTIRAEYPDIPACSQ